MAVDTRNKRFSMMEFDSPISEMMPNPDGTITNLDRQMFLGKYLGIAFNNPTITFVLRLPLLGVG